MRGAAREESKGDIERVLALKSDAPSMGAREIARRLGWVGSDGKPQKGRVESVLRNYGVTLREAKTVASPAESSEQVEVDSPASDDTFTPPTAAQLEDLSLDVLSRIAARNTRQIERVQSLWEAEPVKVLAEQYKLLTNGLQTVTEEIAKRKTEAQRAANFSCWCAAYDALEAAWKAAGGEYSDPKVGSSSVDDGFDSTP